MSEHPARPARDPAAKGKSRTTDPTGPIRKRRKRTVVSGASDDCFACSKRGARCDRRRPYCSQCLEMGRECSGYKTTLTWGVGVASRGKLRGQTLPVVEAAEGPSGASSKTSPPSEPQQAQPQQPQQQTCQPTRSSAQSQPPSQIATGAPASAPPIGMAPDRLGIAPQASMEFDPRSPSATSQMSDMSRNLAWSMDMPDLQSWSNASTIAPQISLPPAIPNRSVMANHSSPGIASDASIQYQPTLSPETGFTTPMWPVAQNWAAQNSTPPSQDADEEYERHTPENSILWNHGHSPSYSQMLISRSVGRTPRLRYLISYFTEVIAPMIVAFDTPSNPFRTQVLHLAQSSEALQEAIATLATSNLRQRRERNHLSTERTLPARLSSMAHRALTDEAFQDKYGISVPEAYAREENYHRGMAVKALNADLADPQRRLSDSVLATLLVLCLFHGCDTGVAEFRSQFAGVTRLLAIRMRHSPVVSDDLKWFIRMFSWFDTLTATTNDRDVQLRGRCLEISSRTDSEWGLENLAGCDGRLFKMISQLGRLNILSQEQEPTDPRPADVTIPTASLPPNMVFPGWDTVTSATGLGLSAGLGYGFSIPTPPQSSDQARKPSSPAFWTEWYSLRQRLESWRFDPPAEASFPSPPLSTSSASWNAPTFTPVPSSSPQYYVAPENLQDVYQISECFRHAALLYCERLAEPSLPSRHPRIQHLVLLAMHCLCAVQSDVYLLWPLFIVGSECVQEDHRASIRHRCRDISKDSGFVNNISCLELLEKIWAEHSDESSYPVYPSGMAPPLLDGSRARFTSQAFRWSRVMQAKRADGEYMVV
ncbi:hypothetical protein N7462_004503 [Penicillium macrosclerotiorum]|uniref:uncharacterized protein n=1 Tax=Penicillium macrosclerotiorum TaxID=303699 RepID=UPI002548E83C|nr:uncharacterized protein N7462_004503 [Penicillium macrosclerotiorum]KAJ5690111.1 hypothetical protein N7462_004503 [Penicillium macrosclerotiorum]